MDRVAVAKLIFSGTSTAASVWSIFSAHVTDTLWLCNDFANRDQKSLFAAFQSHSSISSIKSVSWLQCHSVNVCANCASMICFTTSSRRRHWSTCCSNACVSTPDGRGPSWPPSAVGKVYREFALDHGTCHSFLYACTQIFPRPSMWCVRCLIITESPKTPSHYRYQILVLGYIPYTGLAVFGLRFLVFLCMLRFRFLKFVFSTLQSRSWFQLANSCLLRGYESSLIRIDILSFLLPIGIFSRWFVGCLVRLICSRS